MADPDTDIRQMFFHVQDEVVRETDGKQRPEISVSLVGEYKLKITITPVNPGGTAPPGGSAPIIVGPSEAERAWGFVKDSTSQEVLGDFIGRFPDSIYAKLAREKLEELKKKAQVAVVAPPVMPPSPCSAGAVAASLSSGAAAPLSAAEECSLKPKDTFKECASCPEMVVVPAGTFTMGSPASEPGRKDDEGPQHHVTFRRPFAVGKFLVTLDQFAAFVKDTGYSAGEECYTFEDGQQDKRSGRSWRNPGFPQGGLHPAVCLSWNDADAYVRWVSQRTGRDYRLLSEAEYEYAMRARTTPGQAPRYFFGDSEASMCRYGNGLDQTAKQKIAGLPKTARFFSCGDGYAYTAPVGSFEPNGFGLHDMHGNAWSWTEDCYSGSYDGAPTDGSPWVKSACGAYVARGGAWGRNPDDLRSARRGTFVSILRLQMVGLRVARTLNAP